MRLLFTYLRNHRKTLIAALILAAINQIFSLLDPQIFRLLVDNYIIKAQEIPQDKFVRGVGLLLLAAVGVAFVSRVAKNFQDYYVNVISQKIGATMYASSIAHTFSLPFSVFEDQRSGELLGKLQKARTDSERLLNSMINTVFISAVGIIFVLGYSYYVHWTIGLAFTLMIPFLAAVTFSITKRLKNIQKQIVGQVAELAGSTTETIRNVELVKSLGLEDQETKQLNKTNEAILELELKKVRMTRMLSFIQGTTINTVRSLILLLMFWLIYRGQISLGEYFSLLFYSFFIFGPLQELGNVATQYQEAKGSMEVLENVLSLPPETKPEDPESIETIDKIKFDQINFSYVEGRPVLKELNLEIKKGETVAFVGPSGSGKTTIIKLILGLYKPNSGKLEINDIDSSRIDYEYLRNKIGYVSQDTQLFAGTIRENLQFVKPHASDEECMRALSQSSALHIIERGGEGLNTKIGEGGIKLSGGEKQRLAIARSLLRQPELIIFDEATSSLDSITEKEIITTIEDVVKNNPNLITVLIAHRLSTVAAADRIYVMEKGSIAEVGEHTNLIDSGGLYAALWRSQSAQA